MVETTNNNVEEKKSLNFIEQKIEKDLAAGLNGGRMQTRFPPEPNGYLHIGHAKAIALDFGMAKQYGGTCNLRFDDTNPTKEDTEYIESIENDIKWLGFQWDNVYYASDYFQELWDFAEWLIMQGRAYIDEQSAEVIAQQKGTVYRKYAVPFCYTRRANSPCRLQYTYSMPWPRSCMRVSALPSGYHFTSVSRSPVTHAAKER